MKQVAEAYLDTKVTDAVITVPGYFNNTQRQATKDAGEIAGLNVMRIINEPTAAAIAYGLHEISEMKEAKNILVFDHGGGTFDVSLLTMDNDDNKSIDILAVYGDSHLGVVEFTNKLVTYMQHVVKTKHGADISNDKRAMKRLHNAWEKVKILLSSTSEANIDLDELAPNVDFLETVTRVKFEDLCQNIFSKIIEPLQSVLGEAKLYKCEIDEVVLVGGSTRIPKIQELVSNFFDGKNLNRSINPDEAVACGAAVQYRLLNVSNGNTLDDLVLLDVIPMALGIEVRDGSMEKILKRNTKITTQKTWTIGKIPHKNQTKFPIVN